jgi:hypothetical protein
MPAYCGHSHRARFRETRIIEPVIRRAPTHEEIARLAYQYWEMRGRRHGDALRDWLRAECELQAKTK